MKKLFEPLKLRFAEPLWAHNPEICLIDTILEQHPQIIMNMAVDVYCGNKESNFGRDDTPSVEQVVRGALYKELRGIDYEELAFQQYDSNICVEFIKLDKYRYSSKTWQKYIARIRKERLEELMVLINKTAIEAGFEDISKVVPDSTVVETDIHYPTNNSLVWDCIKESHRLLRHLKEEISGISYRNYLNGAKRTCYKISNSKSDDRRTELFLKQLVTFTKCINQVSNIVKKKEVMEALDVTVLGIAEEMKDLIPVMEQVYDITERREIKKEAVPVEDKIFSIYERHTDIIVKGKREVEFGHKVNLVSGKSALILGVTVLEGNPADSKIFQGAMSDIIGNYERKPKSVATDGGFASKGNLEWAEGQGIMNIVFNKVVGSLKNKVSSKNMESRLKKWRSSIEAVISNLKRGFDIRRCTWKGFEHFCQKVLWSVIGYNIRVIASLALKRGAMSAAKSPSR